MGGLLSKVRPEPKENFQRLALKIGKVLEGQNMADAGMALTLVVQALDMEATMAGGHQAGSFKEAFVESLKPGTNSAKSTAAGIA